MLWNAPEPMTFAAFGRMLSRDLNGGCDVTATESWPRSGVVKVLAIDGGGARGIIPSVFIAEIERRCGRPVHEIFDVVAGTSTGAFISLLLTHAERPYTGDEIVQLYVDRAHDFFSRSLLWSIVSLGGWALPKYTGRSTERTLRDVLGETATLRGARTEVVVPIYSLQQRYPRLEYLSRARAALPVVPDFDFPIWKVARAATSAPGYFPGMELLSVPEGEARRAIHPVDGGIFANNPSIVGLTHAMQLLAERGHVMQGHGFATSDVRFVLVSLGTGYHDQPIPAWKPHWWGMLTWGVHLLDVMSDAQDWMVESQVRHMLPASHVLRLQPILEKPIDLDDTRPATLAALRAFALKELAEESAALDAMCTLLKE